VAHEVQRGWREVKAMKAGSKWGEMSGWQGLLVEPGREYYKMSGKHRKAYAFHGALSPSTEPMTLEFLDEGSIGLGHFEDVDHNSAQPGLQTKFDVQAEPLERLLRAVDPSRSTVDFWSLDIEGSEGMVLESTDFTKIEVGVLMVETNKNAVNNERCAKALARALARATRSARGSGLWSRRWTA